MRGKGFTHISAVLYQRSGYQQDSVQIWYLHQSQGNIVSQLIPHFFYRTSKANTDYDNFDSFRQLYAPLVCVVFFLGGGDYVRMCVRDVMGTISASWFAAELISVPVAQIVEYSANKPRSWDSQGKHIVASCVAYCTLNFKMLWIKWMFLQSWPRLHSLKGAVCKFLTLLKSKSFFDSLHSFIHSFILKHKNTIICLQIFKKHAKLTYLFIWKTVLQSVILLWKCAFRAGMSVSVLVCEIRPLPVYSIVFRHPGCQLAENTAYFMSFLVMCARSCWCR